MKIKVKKRNSTRKPQKSELITHLKLPQINRPKWADNLRFPDDLTEVTAANVSELLGKYTSLWAFVNEDACRTTQHLLRLDSAEQTRMNQMIGRRPALTTLEKFRRDQLFAVDPVIATYRREKKILHIHKAASDMFLANYDKYINALSRELTRKGMLETIGPKYASQR